MDAFAERMERLGRAMAIYERFSAEAPGDPARVESLLAENADLADLLAPMLDGGAAMTYSESESDADAGAAVVRRSSDTLRPGDQVGPYVVIEEIGAGGMGAVYLVAQEVPVRRRAALKLIKLGMDTREVFARFEFERRTLALMDHPCIARVFDSGTTPEGRPYFVMEYVPGQDLLAYSDSQTLSMRARLELLARVCDAVYHAHQRGIIHRDLKPSNILITDQDSGPVPKVIDFGIAKAIEGEFAEQTQLTSSGQRIGTPEYMSPEQARNRGEGADLDTRTDVYSLGVVMYELLVGALPFSMVRPGPGGVDDLLADIRERDPKRPSTHLSTRSARSSEIASARQTEVATLRRQLRGDLDWIVLKAMAKERSRRYDSVASFAADIRRFLRNEPVEARPPTRTYRLAKFVRRYRIQVSAAALVLLSLVSGLIISTVLYLDANAARQDAERSSATATQVIDYLVGLFRGAMPSATQGKDLRVLDVLDPGLRRLRGKSIEDPLVRARLLAALGQVYGALGIHATAADLLRESQKIAMEAGDGALEQASFGQDLALNLGQVLLAHGDNEGALDIYRDICARLQVAGESATTHYAYFRAQMAIGAVRQGQRQDAEDLLAEAVACKNSTEAPDGTSAELMLSLARGYFELEHFAAAKTCADEACEVLVELYPDGHPKMASALLLLGSSCMKLRDGRGGAVAIDRAVREIERFFGEDHYYVAYPLQVHAELLRQVGRRAEAESYYARCIAKLRQARGNPRHMLGRVLTSLGLLQFERRMLKEAEATLREAVELLAETFVGAHVDRAVAMSNLGSVLAASHDLPAAEAMMARAGTMLRQLKSKRLALTLSAHANLRVRQQRLGEALKLNQEVLELTESDPANRLAWANSQVSLALIHNLQHRPKNAETAARAALVALAQEKVQSSSVLGDAHYYLGWALSSQGQREESQRELRSAITQHRAAVPQGCPAEAFAQDMLGTMLFGQKNYAAARPHLQRAYDLRQRDLPESAHFRIVSAHNLGALLFQMGELVAAQASMREAVQLRRQHFRSPNSDLAASLLWAARIEIAKKNWAGAESAAAQSLAQYNRLVPKGHWLVATVISLQGEIRMHLDDLDGARLLFESALPSFAAGTPGRRAALQRLIRVHERRNEPALVAKYRKELLAQ